MTGESQDFEPNRVKKGSSRARWFFSKIGIMSARERRKRQDPDE